MEDCKTPLELEDYAALITQELLLIPFRLYNATVINDYKKVLDPCSNTLAKKDTCDMHKVRGW